MKDLRLLVVGIIFLTVAVAHLLRLIFKVSVTVNNFAVPLWFSAVGLLVALCLAIWMLRS